MYLIEYPNKDGAPSLRLCELQRTRDGDIEVLQYGIVTFQAAPEYRRLKRDKLNKFSVVRELKPEEIDLVCGTAPKICINDPFQDW